MKLIIFIVIFLLLGGFFIISNHDLSLGNGDDIEVFFKKYSEWIDSLFGNGKEMTGYVVNMKWLPDEGNVIELE